MAFWEWEAAVLTPLVRIYVYAVLKSCSFDTIRSHMLSSCVIAAARALMDVPDMSAEDVAKKAMGIASKMCVYTNDNFRTETIESKQETKE